MDLGSELRRTEGLLARACRRFVCFRGRTVRAMARATQPEFGTRHRKPPQQWNLDDKPGRRRIDWALVSLVVAVFIAGFVWLF